MWLLACASFWFALHKAARRKLPNGGTVSVTDERPCLALRIHQVLEDRVLLLDLPVALPDRHNVHGGFRIGGRRLADDLEPDALVRTSRVLVAEIPPRDDLPLGSLQGDEPCVEDVPQRGLPSQPESVTSGQPAHSEETLLAVVWVNDKDIALEVGLLERKAFLLLLHGLALLRGQVIEVASAESEAAEERRGLGSLRPLLDLGCLPNHCIRQPVAHCLGTWRYPPWKGSSGFSRDIQPSVHFMIGSSLGSSGPFGPK